MLLRECPAVVIKLGIEEHFAIKLNKGLLQIRQSSPKR